MNLIDSNHTKAAPSHFNRLKSVCSTSFSASTSSNSTVSCNTMNESKKTNQFINTKANSSSDQENKYNPNCTSSKSSKSDQLNSKSNQQLTNGNHLNGASLVDTTKSKRSRVLINNEFCSYCDEGGNLINCDRCPVSFHLLCHEPPLDLDKIPKGEFLCNNCTIKAKLAANSASRHAVKQAHQQANSNTLINDSNLIAILKSKQDTSIDLLVKIGKSLNPRQMELSKDMQTFCEFSIPGATKIKPLTNENTINMKKNVHLESHLNLSFINNNKKITSDFVLNKHLNGFENLFNSNQIENAVAELKKDDSTPNNYQLNNFKRVNNQNGNQQQQQQQKSAENELYSRVCCVCEKNGQNVVRCDFCSSTYHFDCLNPPLCSMPAKEKYWMCPKHVEPYLDAKWLNSLRLTDRIKLWMKYNVHGDEFNRLKIRNQFIEKCNENSKKFHIELSSKQAKLLPTQSPSKCLCKSNDIPESIKIMYSRYMKRRKTSIDAEESYSIEKCKEVDEDERLKVAQSLLSLATHEPIQLMASRSLTKQTKAIIRLVSVDLSQNQLKNSTRTQIEINQNVVFIGLDSKMDICLKDFEVNRFNNQKESCKCLSEKHACIYYDELTNTFELLNYSPFGTRVDGFLYSYDVKPVVDGHRKESTSQKMCNCIKEFKSKKRKTWEGPISLKNLSRIEFGCFVFEFVILNSSFIENKNENRSLAKKKFSISSFKSLKCNETFAQQQHLAATGYEDILQRKAILKKLKSMRKSIKRIDKKRLGKILIKNKNHVEVLLKLSNNNQNKKALL